MYAVGDCISSVYRSATPSGAAIRACLTLVVFIVSLSSFDALVLCTQLSLVLVVCILDTSYAVSVVVILTKSVPLKLLCV